jgi:hypothetical protein
VFSRISRACPTVGKTIADGQALELEISTGADESHAILHHEAASKFLGQVLDWAKYSADMARLLMDFAGLIRFNAWNLNFCERDR